MKATGYCLLALIIAVLWWVDEQLNGPDPKDDEA